MTNRRRFLQTGALAAVGLLASSVSTPAAAPPVAPLKAKRLRKFVDELPRPPRISAATIDIPITEFSQKLHADLPPTLLWGYAGSYPGPTIEAIRGRPVRVTWRNELHRPALLASLPVDQTLHWANPLGSPHSRRRYRGPVPLVTHLHGAETDSQSDGHPEAWFTPGFAKKGPAWAREWDEFPNAQPGTTLWYHDHALGITRLTMYAGLAGFYLLREPELERSLNLPSGDYEREIIIHDRSFDVKGRLLYPQRGKDHHPFWNPESFGDAIVVNGKLWPHLKVEPRKYRLRLLNGSNARFYRLRLSDTRPFTQIGSDGGFLAAPVEVRELLLAPSERADVIVDFSGLGTGKTVVMTNDAPAPFPDGDDKPDPESTGVVMQFRVGSLNGVDTSKIPAKLVEVPALPAPGVTRTLTLDEHAGAHGPHIMLLDGKRWMDPISETPELGATELWEFANLTDDAHPMHLHLVQFQVLNRQAFDAKKMGKLKQGRRGPLSGYLSGPAKRPDANERGWKDTVRANPGEVTRILVRFANAAGGAFPFDATAGPGYVWHCHVAEHEDNEMMRPYKLSAA